ncbi:hypothetical protein UFOVP276_67 [uncultured Caudovirales phage]|uniref:Uncharacterized protein n=1 Tax=uncultured Caudovirales phage TaxID=2100421 RepID=A0A6J5LBF6_9CAUD|nr:hypothetical protein UFOVP127_204 [uncultured Caudovirales phage]CAB4135089.1 hypothetical protein UFOVP276_67 [uncultured Caudovirales phage]
MTEVVPFFATEEERKTVDTLPTDTTTVASLVDAIPKFNDVVRGNLLVQWTFLFGRTRSRTLEYHIYKIDRKNVFDLAEKALHGATSPSDRQIISTEANAALESIPWWPGFEETLQQVLGEHFKQTAGRYGYHLEVDSWSVSIDANTFLLPTPYIEAFADKLRAKIEG